MERKGENMNQYQPQIQTRPTYRRPSGGGFLIMSAVFCYVAASACLIKGIFAAVAYQKALTETPDEFGINHLAVGMSETFLVLYFAGFAALIGIGQCCSRLSRV